MIIVLTPEQEAWLAARIAKGEFASAQDAIAQLIDARMAETPDDDGPDDFAWGEALCR